MVCIQAKNFGMVMAPTLGSLSEIGKLEKPVTMPDIKDDALKPMHKRGDRVILQHAGATRHLK